MSTSTTFATSKKEQENIADIVRKAHVLARTLKVDIALMADLKLARLSDCDLKEIVEIIRCPRGYDDGETTENN